MTSTADSTTTRISRTILALLVLFFLAWVVGGLLLAEVHGGGSSTTTFLMMPIAFMAVGGLVAYQRPEHKIGWLFMTVALLWVSGSFCVEYARLALGPKDVDLPFATLAAWYQEWYWIPWLFLIAGGLFLLFPSGELPSPRWRPFARVLVALIVTLGILAATDPVLDVADSSIKVANPMGQSWGADPDDEGLLSFLFFGLLLTMIGAGVTALIVRFRRSRGIERQQLKWFVFASITGIAGFLIFIALDAFGIGRTPWIDSVFMSLAPISAGIAILRYRLYDIDVLINRTLVYAALTAILAVIYFGAVALLQAVLRPLTGTSEVAVAASTLATAALFAPVRSRVQRTIDHFFYRRKYDADRALDEFAGKLRDEIDLDTLTRELLEVVDDTMKPVHVSIWLRTTDGETRPGSPSTVAPHSGGMVAWS